MAGLCRTCQLYYASSGTCAEYGPVPVMPDSCIRYVEDHFLTRAVGTRMGGGTDRAAQSAAGEQEPTSTRSGAQEPRAAAPETPAPRAPAARRGWSRRRLGVEVEARVLELLATGLTQGEVANRAGISVTSVRRIIARNRRLASPVPERTMNAVQAGSALCVAEAAKLAAAPVPGLCATCGRARVCWVRRQVDDATSDPLLNVRAAVVECEAYEAKGEKAS